MKIKKIICTVFAGIMAMSLFVGCSRTFNLSSGGSIVVKDDGSWYTEGRSPKLSGGANSASYVGATATLTDSNGRTYIAQYNKNTKKYDFTLDR